VKFWANVSYVGGWFALATFMQPRFLLIAFGVAALWALKVVGIKNQIRIAALVTAVMMVAPITMIYRNSVAIEKTVISTNFSSALRIGAGPETSGGYNRTGPEIQCPVSESGQSLTENQYVICIVKWYLTNPLDTIRLSFNKTKYFWSPWSGPETDGTMARNPWLKISPTHQIATGSQRGYDLIYGPIGVIVSYLWMLGQLIFLFVGYRALRKIGKDEKFFARILLTPVVLSWLISVGTIGDHRFRIPTMTLSIFLQVAAFLALRKKINERLG
jgi:hypothetical protein